MMTADTKTIFALSSGSLPSGVAVVRISGPLCFEGLRELGLTDLKPRELHLRNLVAPGTSELIDKGLVCIFPGPASFTGEDCAELHIHGGRAVVSTLLSCLSGISGFVMADRGEFSRRAFENGKLDLTEIEGLGDIIYADTEAQRRQALKQSTGEFRKKLELWRKLIIRCRAYLEAEFDFNDEEDVPDSMIDVVVSDCVLLTKEIHGFLNDGRKGEIIRDGFVVVLAGSPNSGKSSLMNALAGRDVAIVSDEAGTTRDVLEVDIDIDGYLVRVVDTAGIREAESKVEAEGIRRTKIHFQAADLAVWLSACDNPQSAPAGYESATVVTSKSDLLDVDIPGLCLNTVSEDGLDEFYDFIRDSLNSLNSANDGVLITRERHRFELNRCATSLERAVSLLSGNAVLASEELRIAGECIGRLTGFIDVEDLLDIIFADFCIGK
ncbi:MAG: tRNA uridine-5-carboxymethylaminomethyl(34) synthesis GTPase MnmE [Salaquimonas sp.]